jgi:hypothetical protein
MKKTKVILVALAIFIFVTCACRCTIVRSDAQPTPIPCTDVTPNEFPEYGYNYTIQGTSTCAKFQNEIEFALVKDGQGYTPYINPLTSISLDMETGSCWLSESYKYCTEIIEDSLKITVTKNDSTNNEMEG